MWAVSWSVKISKLCNLRCRYCYEWNELANPARISFSDWAKILVAARRYHALQMEHFVEPGRTILYWHGGEPLLLPADYFEAVVRLEREIWGGEPLARREFTNFLQTNLYSLTEEKLNLLDREKFEIGVSLDVVPGQRLTLDGRETERRVVINMGRLRDRGISFSGAVVLAQHTRNRLREIYDFYQDFGIRFTIFPLCASPLNTPSADFSIGDAEIVEALKDLFVHWIDSDFKIEVQPLRKYLDTALLHLMGLEREPYDRAESGERLLLVDTDGTLYTIVDRYAPGASLGNIFAQSLDEILESLPYSSSIERDKQRCWRHCGGCEYRGACDTYPLFSEPYRSGSSHCRVAFELITFIEHFLRKEGFDKDEFAETALRTHGLAAC